MPTRMTPRLLLPLATAAVAALALTGCAAASSDEPAAADTAEAVVVNEQLRALVPADIVESGVLTVGAPYSLKPSIFTDDAGEPIGISVDLSQAIGAILGLEVEWHEAADPVTALQSGSIDASMGFLSDSPARESVLTMVPQFQNTSTLITLADSEVTDIESMCGEVLAVVSGSQQEKRAAAISDESCTDEPIEVIAFAASKEALTQVQSGRAAAFAAPRMILEGVVESSAGTFAVTDADYPDFPFAMGVTLDNGDLAEALAGALEILFEDGTYDEILAAWNVPSIALTADQIGVNTGSTAAFPVNK